MRDELAALDRTLPRNADVEILPKAKGWIKLSPLAPQPDPPNLLALVFDNQSYANMGATATARSTDLAKMAQGAGVKTAATITTIEDFAAVIKPALEASELNFLVLKSESGRAQVKVDSRLIHGRPMLEHFITALLRHPDYRGKSMAGKD